MSADTSAPKAFESFVVVLFKVVDGDEVHISRVIDCEELCLGLGVGKWAIFMPSTAAVSESEYAVSSFYSRNQWWLLL